MQINRRHAWDLSPKEAVAVQRDLGAEIVSARPIEMDTVRLVAGVDVSVRDGVSQAAVVVASFPDLVPIETVRARRPTPFPYIPGLLTFREGPVLEEAFEKLENIPDVFVFDGMGIAHPRRMGIASHLGLWLERPTIGCGKTLFVGTHDPVPEEKGSSTRLVHRDEVIGVALRTRTATRPVYISPGHLADLQSSVAFILACTPKYRLPEPIRMAHHAAGLCVTDEGMGSGG